MSDAISNPLAGWPSKGYTGPQPWDLDALGISRIARDALGPGQANTIAPKVSHSTYPILTSGSADPTVHELGRMLGELGYPNSASDGENAFGYVDATVMGAIRRFRTDYGVRPDPSAFHGNIALAENHIDPWTVEAILRAHAKLAVAA